MMIGLNRELLEKGRLTGAMGTRPTGLAREAAHRDVLRRGSPRLML